jgi:WD40 repeat protein
VNRHALQVGLPVFFFDGTGQAELRVLQSVVADQASNTTTVTWRPSLPWEQRSAPTLWTYRAQTALFGYNAPAWEEVPPAVQRQYCPDMPTAIGCVAYAPDGTSAISGQADGSLIVWSIAASSIAATPVVQRARWHAHDGPVFAVAFAPDGQTVVSGGADGWMKQWTITGGLVRTYGDGAGAINSVACSSNAAAALQLLSGSSTGALTLWRSDGSVRQTFTGHQGSVNSVVFSPEFDADDELLSGSADYTVKLWRATSPVAVTTFIGHLGAVNSVTMWRRDATSNHHRFLSGSDDLTVKLWDTGQPTALQTFTGHTGPVTCVAFAPTSDQLPVFLLSGSSDLTLLLWRVEPNPRPVMLSYQLLPIRAIAYKPAPAVGGGLVLSASDDSTLVLWNMNTTQPIALGVQDVGCDDWPCFKLNPRQIDLTTTVPAIATGDGAALWNTSSTEWQAVSVFSASQVSLERFLLSATVTRIVPEAAVDTSLFDRRRAVALTDHQPLSLADVPEAAVWPPCPDARESALEENAERIRLDKVVTDLTPGHVLVLTGEVAARDPPRGTGAVAAEVVVVAGTSLDHSRQHTILELERSVERRYLCATVSLNANVAPATQGRAVTPEVLGSGDGARSNQQFVLAQQPLTYLPAANARGNQSTLSVSVDGAAWDETPSFLGKDATSQTFIVRAGATGETSVVFGDGRNGRRLPTGTDNVVARYRVGLGLAGEVAPGSLTQMLDQPSPVTGVVNPLRPTGAADPDTLESARQRAPARAVLVDRALSLPDYERFAATFAGIGLARASVLWDGRCQVIHLTVLGADGEPIPNESPLFSSLAAALDRVRDPAQPLVVESGPMTLAPFNLAAGIRVRPGEDAPEVLQATERTLAIAFSATQRQLGQAVAASDVLSVMQGVRGVAGADLTLLFRVGQPAALTDRLPAGVARWDARIGRFVPDELLIVNPAGIAITQVTPP